MKTQRRIVSLIILTTIVLSVSAMKFENITDYLSAGGQLSFNGAKYELKWSSHPSGDYYKQEYLKQGEELGNYHNMLLIEAISGNMKVKDALETKLSELETRKKMGLCSKLQGL